MYRTTRNIVRASLALVTASIALFVALGGTAGASEQAAVPLAKRALVADNAKKLNGLTAVQLGGAAAQAAVQTALKESPAGPRPASTAAGLAVIKTQAVGQLAPGTAGTWSVACDSGTKVIGGGMSSDGLVVVFDSYPKGDASWEASGGNLGSGAANVSVYAICLK